jgi:undecaprenyl pyrophosphate phosphatase UppP
VAGIGWAILGLVASWNHSDVPWFYWVPLAAVVPTYLLLWWPAQSFRRQSWEARAREMPTLVSLAEGNKFWVVWFISVGSVPVALWGIVIGPTASDRLGSAVVLLVALAVAIGGLKLLDARISRRHDSDSSKGSVGGR